MPQMSPILWTMILFLTTLTIYQINSTIKFEQMIKKKKKNKKNKKLMFIKW